MKANTTILFLFLLSFLLAKAQKEKIYITDETKAAITIDGNLSEKAWKQVKWGGNFSQPKSGQKPTFDTQFKILYDQNNLYVAIRAFDKQPDSIAISNKPRDYFAGDYVEINIDSDFDGKDAFSFTMTAAGIRGDEHIKTSQNWFNDWNPDWSAKVQIDREGWIAELRIPLRELDIYNKTPYWGIQVNRSIARLGEGSSWAPVTDENKWVESFGILKGILNLPVSKGFSLTERIKPDRLKKDFTDLYTSLKSFYPSLYRYRSLDYINDNYHRTLMVLEKEMTLTDFYRTVLSFIGKIGDGHMKIELPEYFTKTYYKELKKLPLKLKATGNGLFVQQNYSKNDLLTDARIIAINGVSAHNIAEKLIDLIPSDGHNLTGRYYRLSENFDFYYSLVWGINQDLNIDFIAKGQQNIRSKNIPLLDETEFQKIGSTLGIHSDHKSFDYWVKDNVGILTIRTFNHAEGFQDFVDESFMKIAASKIDKLILDFRGNGGGEETNAIHLYSYLTDRPFKYYDRYEVGIEPHTKVHQDSTLMSYETLNFFADMVTKDEWNRNVITNFELLENRFIDPAEQQKPKKENNFNSKIVVLIDGGSFSATSEICAIMKRDGRATFMGTETGGAFDGNTSGIYDQITLPNSRLKVKIPLIKYVSATEDTQFLYGRGVIPDFQVAEYPTNSVNLENDVLIDFAIDILDNKE